MEKDFDKWNEVKKGTNAEAPRLYTVQIHPLRISVGFVQGKLASALLSQVRIIDSRRLVEKVGFMDKQVFAQLKKALKELL